MELFRDGLRKRRADVLADLRLSRVNTDLAVFADVEPRGELGRWRLAASASAAPAGARLLLGLGRVQ